MNNPIQDSTYSIEKTNVEIFIPHIHFKQNLLDELIGSTESFENYILSEPQKESVIWAQDTWQTVGKIVFSSINQAVKALRSLTKNWYLHTASSHRRATLIQDKLAKFKINRIEFNDHQDPLKFGCWLLHDNNTIYYSLDTSKNKPGGIYEFNENKTFPPNRAYLKLWETFTLFNQYPNEFDECLDLGGSPGGWSWVLQSLGCAVTAVDKAPLDKKILELPNIKMLQQSAFALEPNDYPNLKWFCSDIICYPDRLLKLIHQWLDAGCQANFICTIKLQGDTDMKLFDQFLAIKGSTITHLYHNKNEVTWVLIQ
ncbi:MAG: hypothetical protein COA79_18225 [Planctomycetota bacterium]|nr:MAG: hypothetical protein COA79_18225 [Planctomycetota bacterium]